MPLIDDRGRVFGRFNLIDVIIVVVLAALLPAAYAAALLMRPAGPTIESVSAAEINLADRRLGGSVMTTKLKVLGSGLTPMLRAQVGTTPALAFVFEHPNSADVLVGALPPGEHDLVLFDGVQEVARAPKAVVIAAPPARYIRVSGWASGDEAFITQLTPGFRFPDQRHAFEVVAAGPVMRGANAAGQRRVLLLLRCDPGGDTCLVGGRTFGGEQAIPVDLPAPNGSFRVMVDEAFPETPPTPATVTVAFTSAAAVPAANDRDQLLDSRAAVVRSVTRSGGETVVTFAVGADRDRDGWQYRGRPLKAGAPFRFETDTYVLIGEIRRVAVDAAKAEAR